MNRAEATSIIFAEAFSETGLVMLAHHGDDPGFHRVEALISAINFLAVDLRREDTLDRVLVAALFELGMQVPEDLHRGISPTSDSRCSLFQQSIDLQIAVHSLIENWDNWPNEEDMLNMKHPERSVDDSLSVLVDEEFEGYRAGDITYCIDPRAENLFPVRVIRLGFNVIEVEALFANILMDTCETFLEDRLNRCFQSPRLPGGARFGGFDERPVNTARQSGPELRLLPSHYATTTGKLIRERHSQDPESWPLPTGKVFERWFKDRE